MPIYCKRLTHKTKQNEKPIIYRRLIFIRYRDRTTALQGGNKVGSGLQINHNKQGNGVLQRAQPEPRKM